MEIDMLFDKDFIEKNGGREPGVVLTLAELFELVDTAAKLGREEAEKELKGESKADKDKEIKGEWKCHKSLKDKKVKRVKVKDGRRVELAHKCLGELTDEQLKRVVIKDSDGREYGTPGTPTGYVDCSGKKLCLGDVVIVDLKQKRGWDCAYPLTLVVDNGRKVFVDGIEMWCDAEKGTIDSRARVKKVKSWSETEVGDVYKGGELGIAVR